MEFLDNDNDKGIYWVVFFVILLIMAIVGYKFVFSYHKPKDENKTDEELAEGFKFDDYKGTWVLYGDEDKVVQELRINIVDGSTLTFDYSIEEIVSFESKTAELEDNVATFDIEDSDSEMNISGRLIFRNDKIFLVITSANSSDISLGTIEFSEKMDNEV